MREHPIYNKGPRPTGKRMNDEFSTASAPRCQK